MDDAEDVEDDEDAKAERWSMDQGSARQSSKQRGTESEHEESRALLEDWVAEEKAALDCRVPKHTTSPPLVVEVALFAARSRSRYRAPSQREAAFPSRVPSLVELSLSLSLSLSLPC